MIHAHSISRSSPEWIPNLRYRNGIGRKNGRQINIPSPYCVWRNRSCIPQAPSHGQTPFLWRVVWGLWNGFYGNKGGGEKKGEEGERGEREKEERGKERGGKRGKERKGEREKGTWGSKDSAISCVQASSIYAELKVVSSTFGKE